jgi:hypothetical protein
VHRVLRGATRRYRALVSLLSFSCCSGFSGRGNLVPRISHILRKRWDALENLDKLYPKRVDHL